MPPLRRGLPQDGSLDRRAAPSGHRLSERVRGFVTDANASHPPRNSLATLSPLRGARERASSPPSPQPAVAPRHIGQAVLVVRPACVFRELEVLLGRLPAFAVLRLRLHL